MAKVKASLIDTAERQFLAASYMGARAACLNATENTDIESAIDAQCRNMILYDVRGQGFFDITQVDRLKEIIEGLRRYVGGKSLFAQSEQSIDDAITICRPTLIAESDPDSHPVQELEAVLNAPRLATKSSLPELSKVLNKVANWLEFYEEAEFDRLAKDAKSVARSCESGIIKDEYLFQESTELFGEVLPIYQALTGDILITPESILATALRQGSTKAQIDAAIQLFVSRGNKTIEKQIEICFVNGDTALARVMARRTLSQLKL